jgi:ketosteroid isomerase-like protein
MEKWMFRSVPVRAARSGRAFRGMVRDRMAIVGKCFDAWKSNCFDSLGHHVDPAVEVDWSQSLAPYRGIYSGHAGWQHLFDEIRAPFEDVSAEPDGFVVAGQHIAVPNTTRMRGRDGVEVVARCTFVFTFRGVKLVRLRLYQREAEALAAIGVERA